MTTDRDLDDLARAVDNIFAPASRRMVGRAGLHRCRCGHPRCAHEHMSRSSHCARCGPGGCGWFRRRRTLFGWKRDRR